MDKEKIIEVREIQKRFGSFLAVKNVSFTVEKGDIFGFLGPNGAGKSTTIRCLLSLITPNAGEISLFGKTYKQNRSEILSKIGSIIEKPDFYKYLSAYKNLELFARISGAEVSKNKILEMIDFVGLSGRESHKVKGFSHGMKQRLGIAQTLLHDPELIILDEPTTGLDPQGIKEIRELILRLKKEYNKTVLLSSHQLHEIELIANKMVIINKGETLIEGEVQEILNNQNLQVEFSVSNVEIVTDLVKKAFPNLMISIESNKILVETKLEHIPIITKFLIDQKVDIYSIEPKKKLEEYFIKMTRQ